MSSLQDQVVNIVNDICRPQRPDLSDDSKPMLQLGIDSLDFASILMAVEEKFDVSFSDSDLERVASLGQIVSFLKQHGKA